MNEVVQPNFPVQDEQPVYPIQHAMCEDPNLNDSDSENENGPLPDYDLTIGEAAVDEFDDGVNKKRKKKQCPDLDVFAKWAIVVRVIQETNRASKRLKTGSLDLITEEFQVSKRTVQRIYTEYKTQINMGILVPDMTSKKPDRCGAESKLTPEVAENIRALKLKIKGRMTARGMAEAYENEYGTKMPYMTLYRYERKLSGKL